MNVSEAIRTKRAVRQFKAEPLPEDVVTAILKAGRRSQSSKNTQPWRFVAVTEWKTLEKLSKLGQYAGHIAGAGLAVVIFTPDPNQRFSIMFDAGQAAAYMQLAAWELGVGSCLASIYEPEQARELLCAPAAWHTRIAISFGYPADESVLTNPPKAGGRSGFDDLVHFNRWDNSTCNE